MSKDMETTEKKTLDTPEETTWEGQDAYQASLRDVTDRKPR